MKNLKTILLESCFNENNKDIDLYYHTDSTYVIDNCNVLIDELQEWIKDDNNIRKISIDVEDTRKGLECCIEFIDKYFKRSGKNKIELRQDMPELDLSTNDDYTFEIILDLIDNYGFIKNNKSILQTYMPAARIRGLKYANTNHYFDLFYGLLHSNAF